MTYKSRGVVILDGLCVAKGLEDWVCLQQLGLQLPLARGKTSLGREGHTGTAHQLLAPTGMVVGGPRHCGKVLDHFLGVLSLPGSRLPTAQGEERVKGGTWWRIRVEGTEGWRIRIKGAQGWKIRVEGAHRCKIRVEGAQGWKIGVEEDT